MARPRVHDDTLRERLLDLAARAVTDGGPAALSVRTLATTADTSTAAVYTLFGGMPGLLSQLYARAFDRLEAGQRAVPSSDSPLDDIVALGHAYRGTALDDPNGYRMMFGEFALHAEVEPALQRRAAHGFEPLLAAVRRAVERGLFPSSPAPEAIATALWATSHGLVTLELGAFLPPAATDPGAVFEYATRAAVDGWAARA